MVIGDRLKTIREAKELLRSRVEYGHTVPSVETLEKFARALDRH
jgi:transcriptional regulator with XRE-family HTH domain